MGNNDDDPLRSIKIELRSILVADQDPMTAKEIARCYLDHFDYSLDPYRYKCANLEILLESMPDAVEVIRSNGGTHANRYRAVACEATADIESLVRRQLTKQQAFDRKDRHLYKSLGPSAHHKSAATQFGAAFRNGVVEQAQPLKPTNPYHLSLPGANVRNAVVEDLLWIVTVRNVINGCHRFDKVAVMQMVSPSLFLLSSSHGNASAQRFSKVAKILRRIVDKNGFRQVDVFKDGMGCVIHQEGEYARAVLLSKARKPGYLRFACMDYHAIVEVQSSQVFGFTEDIDKIPCNLFLARIHGISEIPQKFWAPIADKIVAGIEENGVFPLTSCIFLATERRFGPNTFVIDFVHKGRWFSDLLMENRMAPRFNQELSSGRDPALTPAIVSQNLEILEKSGVFAFRSLEANVKFAFSDPKIFPGFARVLHELAPKEQPTPAVSLGPCSPIPAEIIHNGHQIEAPKESNHLLFGAMLKSVQNMLNFSAEQGKEAEASSLLTAYGWGVLAVSGAGKETALGSLLDTIDVF